MRNRRSFVKSESGQILIWVIAIMLLAALIIPPLLASSYSGLHASTIRKERMQELYAADTGVEDAMNWIKSEGDITKPGVSFPEIGDPPVQYDFGEVNESDVEVILERTGNWTYTITSTGTNKYKDTHVKLQVKVTRDTQTFQIEIPQPPVPQDPEYPPGGPFSYAIASLGDGQQFVGAPGGTIDGDIFINGNFNTSPVAGGATNVTGDLYCDGDITLDLSSHVMGNASATGNIYLLSSSIIDENAWANQSITINSNNYIGGDAYAQMDVNVNDGSIVGSAWANHDVNVGSLIRQSAFANYDIDGYYNAGTKKWTYGTIEGWAYYLHALDPNVQVGDSAQLTEAIDVPLALMPALQPNPNPGAVYYGNATTGPGHTTITGNVNISGTVHLGPTLITGNLIFKNNGKLWLDGTVYVNGYIDMTANNCQVLAAQGTVTPAVLVANGDITIKNNNIATPDENMPLIMSVNGDIDCQNNNHVVGALYAPNGTATIMNNTSVYGAVVAQNIVNNNNYSVVYNPAVANIPGLPQGGGPGGPVTPPDEPAPPIYETMVIPGGKVLINSYIVLEE